MEDQTIIEIASQLGLAVDRVFDIFVAAQPIIAVITALLLIGVIIGTLLVYRYMNKVEDKDQIDVIYGTTIISCFIFIILGFCIYNILTAILIPEYTAARELIYLLTP